MSAGLISENGCLSFQLKPHQLSSSTRRKPLNQIPVFVNTTTHNPKANLFIDNRVFSASGSSKFRTKATINDGIVFTANTEDLSFYQLLGISESGSFSEIKQAYKQLARKYHPDVSPPDQTEEYTKRFIQVQEAYEILSDPTMRAMYDRDLARGLHLAFSARKRYYHPRHHHDDEGLDERSNWKNRWQAQLSELKRKSMNRDAGDNMSWGARMRRQRNEPSGEL